MIVINNVTHVDIDCVKTGAVECGRHFQLAVDALFAQDCNLWSLPGGHKRANTSRLDEGFADIFCRIEC